MHMGVIELEDMINIYLSEGWELVGGISMKGNVFMQAVAKPEEKTIDNHKRKIHKRFAKKN